MGRLDFSGAVNARIVGAGDTTLVLAHGFGGNQSVWDEVVPELSRRYRVVTFDWSFSSTVDDHSASKRHFTYDAFSDDLVALADEMRIRDAVYMGHSMAGMIGCIASVKRPEIFRRLVLIGASPRYLKSAEFEGGLDVEDVENIFSGIELDFQQWSASFASLTVGTHDPVSTEKFRTMLRRLRPEAVLSLAKTVLLSDHRRTLASVEASCTIVHCTGDALVPTSVAEYMRKNVKGEASLELIDAPGHFPQLTAPAALIEIVDRALVGSSGQSAAIGELGLGPRDQPAVEEKVAE